MNWRVEWATTAEDELANIWLGAPDRAAVTAAAHAFDVRLATDPSADSESRSGGDRIAFEKPLGVIFQVFPDQRFVKVLQVWYYD